MAKRIASGTLHPFLSFPSLFCWAVLKEIGPTTHHVLDGISLPRFLSLSLNVCALCIYLARKGSQNNGPPRGHGHADRPPARHAIAVAVHCVAALTRRPSVLLPPILPGRSNNHIKRRERPTERTNEQTKGRTGKEAEGREEEQSRAAQRAGPGSAGPGSRG